MNLKPTIKSLLACTFIFLGQPAFAQVHETEPVVSPSVGPTANARLTDAEQLFNFAGMYTVVWGAYLLTQKQTIAERGSWNNWLNNWNKPTFDRDSFEYNIIKHTMVGSAYYQFYRSRGYSIERAFMWTFATSFAFEFTIETVTERPSIQDIYQTPLYGSILGIGLEKVSQACHKSDTFLGHACGYLFDPFTLIPASPKFAIYPNPVTKTYYANVRWDF